MKSNSNFPAFLSFYGYYNKLLYFPAKAASCLLESSFSLFADQYQFKSQSSLSGVDEMDSPGLSTAGIANGTETLSTAADLLNRGAGKFDVCVIAVATNAVFR